MTSDFRPPGLFQLSPTGEPGEELNWEEPQGSKGSFPLDEELGQQKREAEWGGGGVQPRGPEGWRGRQSSSRGDSAPGTMRARAVSVPLNPEDALLLLSGRTDPGPSIRHLPRCCPAAWEAPLAGVKPPGDNRKNADFHQDPRAPWCPPRWGRPSGLTWD